MNENSKSVPYKVVDISRQTKRGIMASSYENLISKANVQFGALFTNVVLDEDGTLINAEYFESIPANTSLMVLKQNEEWHPPTRQDDRFVPKSSNEEDLRKTWYIWWANNKDVKSAFIDYLEQLRMFFNSYYLNWEEEEQHDILYQFFKEKNEIDTSETTTTSTDCELIVLDQCFPRPVYISKRILMNHNREYTSCSVNTLGYQHIFKHNMIDTSASDASSSSCDDLLTDLPPRKKLKTCQQALFVDCGELLKDHMENSHHLKRPGTSMEILILCENSELCIKISKHLGLVFLDSLLYNSEIESYPYPVTQEQKVAIINNIDSRLNNPNAKLYDLLQSIVVKKLITGHNNVGLTCDRNILKYFGASIKCFISKDTENALFCSIKPYLNMIVKLNNDGFLDYISAVGKIVDESVQCKASIAAVYKSTKDKKYYSVGLPIIGILPMYVTNFFAVKKACNFFVGAHVI